MLERSGKTVIVVAGPTGVGKTALAIQLALRFNTEIISADSRQCYQELNVGVARPSPVELATVPHHFIASHSIQDRVDAALFENFALQKTSALFQSHDVVIMAGGTGLYIQAFCEGLDEIPATNPVLRRKIIAAFEQGGLPWLQNEIKEKDPGFFETAEIKNPQRLMRALEIIESTGQSVLSFRKGSKAKRDFNLVKLGVELSKHELHQRINERVEKMIEEGLVEEVKELRHFRTLNALQTVGYTEIFDFLDGKHSLSQAVELIKQNTRRYAKRQMTWFRKDEQIRWYQAARFDEQDRFDDLMNKIDLMI